MNKEILSKIKALVAVAKKRDGDSIRRSVDDSSDPLKNSKIKSSKKEQKFMREIDVAESRLIENENEKFDVDAEIKRLKRTMCGRERSNNSYFISGMAVRYEKKLKELQDMKKKQIHSPKMTKEGKEDGYMDKLEKKSRYDKKYKSERSKARNAVKKKNYIEFAKMRNTTIGENYDVVLEGILNKLKNMISSKKKKNVSTPSIVTAGKNKSVANTVPWKASPNTVPHNASPIDNENYKRKINKKLAFHSGYTHPNVLKHFPNMHKADAGAMLTTLIKNNDRTTKDHIKNQNWKGLANHVAKQVRIKNTKRPISLGGNFNFDKKY